MGDILVSFLNIWWRDYLVSILLPDNALILNLNVPGTKKLQLFGVVRMVDVSKR